MAHATPVTKTLSGDEATAACCLVEGHAPSTASAILKIKPVKEAIFGTFMKTLNDECSTLCKKISNNPSPFRTISATDLVKFTWRALIEELEVKAPTLLTNITSFSDHRNQTKSGPSHHPGICAAVGVLLKERNREMCGPQSIVSLLMYLCHCEKQVILLSTYVIIMWNTYNLTGLQPTQPLKCVPQLSCHTQVGRNTQPYTFHSAAKMDKGGHHF